MTDEHDNEEHRQLLDLYQQFIPAVAPKSGGGKYGASVEEFRRHLREHEDFLMLVAAAID